MALSRGPDTEVGRVGSAGSLLKGGENLVGSCCFSLFQEVSPRSLMKCYLQLLGGSLETGGDWSHLFYSLGAEGK